MAFEPPLSIGRGRLGALLGHDPHSNPDGYVSPVGHRFSHQSADFGRTSVDYEPAHHAGNFLHELPIWYLAIG